MAATRTAVTLEAAVADPAAWRDGGAEGQAAQAQVTTLYARWEDLLVRQEASAPGRRRLPAAAAAPAKMRGRSLGERPRQVGPSRLPAYQPPRPAAHHRRLPLSPPPTLPYSSSMHWRAVSTMAAHAVRSHKQGTLRLA
jgi:hypothetical protein